MLSPATLESPRQRAPSHHCADDPERLSPRQPAHLAAAVQTEMIHHLAIVTAAVADEATAVVGLDFSGQKTRRPTTFPQAFDG
jgi:hypothetical protein